MSKKSSKAKQRRNPGVALQPVVRICQICHPVTSLEDLVAAAHRAGAIVTINLEPIPKPKKKKRKTEIVYGKSYGKS